MVECHQLKRIGQGEESKIVVDWQQVWFLSPPLPLVRKLREVGNWAKSWEILLMSSHL